MVKTDTDIQKLENEIKRLKSAVEELTVLNELALAAGSSMEVDQMLDIIVQKSIKAVKAEQGSILLVTKKQDKPLQTLIRQEDFSGPMQSYRVGNSITGWVLKNRQPLIIKNLAEDERFVTTDLEKKEIRSLLSVPIWFKAEIIGILMVTNKKTAEPFSSGDLRLLSIIAAQSGQLISNSQLQNEAIEKKRLEHELNLAREIQLSLLPNEDPAFPGLEIASFFKPTDAVGGDYYDYINLSDQKLGIVIADVSGHGPSAALMMSMIKGVFFSITQRFLSVNQALDEINTILIGIIPKDIFITMQFLVFDLKNKILQFANAGHNPFLFYNSKSEDCLLTELPGCAFNLKKGVTYSMKEIVLHTNDLILIYTDGVTEAINEDIEMFDKERLIKAVKEVAKESAVDVIANVQKHLFDFSNKTKHDDDIAMIAIKLLE